MGYYINPREGTKEEFLAEYGTKLETPPNKSNKGDNIAVILIQNVMFSAAAICYNQAELKYFLNECGPSKDLRPRQWYTVPIDRLRQFMEGHKID